MAYGSYLIPAGDPRLKQEALPVMPGEWLEKTMRIMERVCARNDVKGVGLAAPQIGVMSRLIFINVNRQPLWMLNPEITYHNDATTLEEEGCLSYPGIHKVIARWTEIKVSYQDDRRQYKHETFHDYKARVIQHEMDHLNGICRVGDGSSPDGFLPAKKDYGRGGAGIALFAAIVGMAAAGSVGRGRPR